MYLCTCTKERPCEHTVLMKRRQRSTSQEEWPHQEPSLPARWSWTSQPPELWETKCPLLRPPNLWYFVIAAQADLTWFDHLICHSTPRYLPKEIYGHTKSCTQMFWTVVLVTAKNYQTTQMSPSRQTIINRLWYIHILDYYSIVKWNKLFIWTTTWMNLKIIMLGERSRQKKCTHCILLCIKL